MKPILPPATIGFVSGGQLGRMLAIAARNLGYGVAVWDILKNSPAGQVADREFVAPFSDEQTADDFAAACEVIIVEWENIPTELLEQLEAKTRVVCSSKLVGISQDREKEKTTFRELGIPTPKFAVMIDAEQVAAAMETVGLPAIFKTTRGGYDGKGQARVTTLEEAATAFAELSLHSSVIAEEMITFEREISVIGARGADGSFVHLPIGENRHADGILDISLVPAQISDDVEKQAIAATEKLATELDIAGVFAVEFFVTADGIVANELAPRVHNSGHWSTSGCTVDQFTLAIRAACGLPLPQPQLTVGGVAMKNILGGDNFESTIEAVLKNPALQLHLYGKSENRTGRKMAHVIATGDSSSAAAQTLAK